MLTKFSAFDDLLDRFWNYDPWNLYYKPSVTLHEVGEGHVSFYAPGFKKNEIEVTAETGKLAIDVNSPTVKQNLKWTLDKEVDVDKIEATLQDGLLTIKLPKTDKKEKARKIEVK